MRSPAKRAISIAIDGASMELVKNMVDWGHMPNLTKLMDRGVYRPMLGVFPTLTPPGWTALYSGSWHGTHRVMDFNIRALGKPLTETVWGIDTGLSQSEYLWNTVERAGKKPILVKVEMSWPPTIESGIQVEGTGPGVSNYHQVAGFHLFVSGNYKPRPVGGPKDPESVDPSRHAREEEVEWVKLQPIEGSSWANLPQSSRPCLEVGLTLKSLHHGRFNMLRGEKGAPKPFFGLVYASGDSGYDKVRVCRSRDGDDAVCELSPGQWSDWWLDSFEIDDETLKGNVRMKLITLTPNADTFELYVPQIWPIEGYTHPAEIASELVQNVGPFLQNPGRDVLGFFTDDTYFEMLEYHHQHLADVTHYLAKNYEWDMIFCETHASDYADHFFLPQADEISNATPEDFKRCREGLIRSYQSIDRWIGRLLELADDDTVVLIASDHGGTPAQFTPVEVTTVLQEAGLLVFDEGGKVDLARSRAVPVGLIHIFVNLKGREPNGIVEPEDYEAVRREVIAAIMEYKDPETGRHPFTLAVTREDAETLNLWSDLVGDIVYAVRPEFDGAHGRHLPVARFGISGQHSTFIMAGPGVRQGMALERQVRVVDVAPTLCHLLGLPMPKNVEGGVIYEALDDPDWYIAALDE